jgi:hypothetical protein
MKTRQQLIKERRQASLYRQPDPEVKDLLQRSASSDTNVSRPAMFEIAKALELPLRQGIMAGNVADGIFEAIEMPPGTAPEFPLDTLAPGTEKNHVAYTIPSHGRIPERAIEGDYIMVPTYEIGNSIDWGLKLARDARWDIVGRAMEIFEAGFVKKYNDDAWHTLLGAAADRNILVSDANAAQGRLTLTLLTKMQQTMRRRAGGNSTSLRRGKLTDIFMSIEAFEDMRTWTLAEIDETTRREIFTSESGGLSSIYNILLHDLLEFGVGQEYQNYYSNTLGASMAASDVEIIVGLDLQRNDSFVNPIRAQLEVFNDDLMLRARRAGVFGWQEHGFAVLDNRRVILGSL